MSSNLDSKQQPTPPLPIPQWNEEQLVRAKAAAKRILMDDDIMLLLVGEGSDFGDATSLIGGYQRTLISELVNPSSRYDKNQCSSGCEILHVFVAHIKGLAEG
jgi:hypothetical protein